MTNYNTYLAVREKVNKGMTVAAATKEVCHEHNLTEPTVRWRYYAEHNKKKGQAAKAREGKQNGNDEITVDPWPSEKAKPMNYKFGYSGSSTITAGPVFFGDPSVTEALQEITDNTPKRLSEQWRELIDEFERSFEAIQKVERILDAINDKETT